MRNIFKTLGTKGILCAAGVILAGITVIALLINTHTERAAGAKAYDEAMRAVVSLDGRALSQITGMGLAAYDVEERCFVERFIPKDLVAERPEDVRAFVKVRAGARKTGSYNAKADAYTRYYHVSLIDAVNGEELVASLSTTIDGSEPPRSISTGPLGTGGSDAYGKLPQEYEVTRWVERAWREAQYQLRMREAFEYGEPPAQPGNKLIQRDASTGEYSTGYIPEEWSTELPEEVGAIVAVDTHVQNGPYSSHKEVAFVFVDPLTGNELPGMKTVCEAVTDNRSNNYMTTAKTTKDLELDAQKWISETWEAFLLDMAGPEIDIANILGAWELVSFEADGEITNVAELFFEMIVTMHEDGTVLLTASGEADAQMTWALRGNKLILSEVSGDDDPWTLVYADGVLTSAVEDMTITFIKRHSSV